MDRVALVVLRRESEADCAVAKEAAMLANERFLGREPRDLEATAYQLVRCYNAIEQAALRVAKAFENQIDDESAWHAELMRRLTLDIPGIRPALFASDDLVRLRELRGFRHVIVHAYDLSLEPKRLELVLADASSVMEVLGRRFAVFFDAVASDFAGENDGGSTQ